MFRRLVKFNFNKGNSSGKMKSDLSVKDQISLVNSFILTKLPRKFMEEILKNSWSWRGSITLQEASYNAVSYQTNPACSIKKLHPTLGKVFLIAVFFVLALNSSLVAATYYTRATGNWNTPATWSTASCGGATATSTPTSGDIVFICNGHTVTINADVTVTDVTINGLLTYETATNRTLTITGNLTINSTGIFRYINNSTKAHNLILSGNLTNSGTVDFYQDTNDYVSTTFSGNSNTVVSGSGTWDLFRIILDKTNKINILEIQAPAFYTNFNGGNWIYTRGTYFHNNTSSFNMGSTANFTINPNVHIKAGAGTLNFASSASLLTLYGTLEVAGGTVNVGSTAGAAPNGLQYDLTTTGITSTLIITSGTLNIFQGLTCISTATTDPFSFTMSGGTLNINTGTTTNRESFNVNNVAGSSFTMTGGLINIQKKTSGTVSDFNVCGTNGTVSSSGTAMVQFGTPTLPLAQWGILNFGFTPYPNVTLPNLKVECANNVANYHVVLRPFTAGNFKILGLHVKPGCYFDMSHDGIATDNRTMTIEGTVDGTHAYINENTDDRTTLPGGNVYFRYRQSTVNFTGSGTISISYPAPEQFNFYNLNCAAPGQITTLTYPIGTANNLRVNGGNLIGVPPAVPGARAIDIYLGGTNPLTFAPGQEANINVFSLRFFGWNITQTLPAGTYNAWIITAGNNFTLSQQGPVTINGSLMVNGDWSNRATTFNTNGHSLSIIGTFQIGQCCSALNTANLGSSTVSVGGNLVIESNGILNAGTSNLSVGENWSNKGIFNRDTGRVTFNNTGAASLICTAPGGEVFYNLVMNKPSISSTVSSTITLNNQASVANSLTLTSGNIVSSAASLLIINATVVSVNGTSHSSFVSGPVRRFGTGAFTFPVGKNTYYRPISINPQGVAGDSFTAEYFQVDPNSSYSVASKDASLSIISRCEYWILDRTHGTTSTPVTLSWDVTSCGVNSLDALVVARWDGTTWRNHNKTAIAGTIGTGAKGFITSETVTSFSPFTLASTSSANPLPLTLLHFKAQLSKEVVELAWQTAESTTPANFVVEKTTDLKTFQPVETAIKSSNQVSYKATDLAPFSGTSYYRLKLTDEHGIITYSSLVSISYDRALQYALHPNPFADSFEIAFQQVDQEKEVSIQIIDMSGRIITPTSIDFNTSNVRIDMSGLPRGLYTVQLVNGNKVVKTKVVKQ